MYLLDECGNYVFCPEDRFEIIFKKGSEDMEIIYRATCPNCNKEMLCASITSDGECIIDLDYLAVCGPLKITARSSDGECIIDLDYLDETVSFECGNCGAEFNIQVDLEGSD